MTVAERDAFNLQLIEMKAEEEYYDTSFDERV